MRSVRREKRCLATSSGSKGLFDASGVRAMYLLDPDVRALPGHPFSDQIVTFADSKSTAEYPSVIHYRFVF